MQFIENPDSEVLVKFLFSAVALAALPPVAAFAQQSSNPAESTDQQVHVTVKVTSSFYGSFTQEKDVDIRQTATFSNLSGVHKSMKYDGPCTLNPAPRDIHDGVVVKITPLLYSKNGQVGFEQDVAASKLLGYHDFNSGKCGNISEASWASDSDGSSVLDRVGQPLQILHQVNDANGAHRDLDVSVIFTPVTAR
ncbi:MULTISPECIES: hypothetical protein [Burkholderiaceae]|jgi:hypothetical protein|uniref:Uncharacterized protein n=2 Tax=Burkholderiaceae TaxID=119060 RepID=B2T0Z5_PARPJ|nr:MULTISPECIES: hypothetical protein [Burkholderiaceae]MDP9546008.1 hypothetical protein [Burkholderia cepacia]UTP22434.1 hypothetical protein NMB33_00755 [Burkholderia sp. FXe9]HEP6275810.1 hypothetical protein [Burkholderia vietnamiensis]ACD14715.1 hypothetical protein Bphyt_0290 [Paraburkholderia phytofirmans PsJN]MBR8391241.1 hypothetical protein [Burkholderia cenocepacia]